MRAPRYRFPEQVRSTTRGIADRMVRNGDIAETPEELDAWLSQEPETRDVLQRGGYGSAFTADDLFPLLQVFVGQLGGPVPAAEPAASSSSKLRWLVIVAVVLGLALLLFAFTARGFSQPVPAGAEAWSEAGQGLGQSAGHRP
jgi:hypothetical protein